MNFNRKGQFYYCIPLEQYVWHISSHSYEAKILILKEFYNNSFKNLHNKNLNKKIETSSLQILRKSLVASENPQFLSKVGDPQFPQKILNTFHSKFSPVLPRDPHPQKSRYFPLSKNVGNNKCISLWRDTKK